MENAVEIKNISASQAVPLRHSVLRPHQTPSQCEYPGDENSESLHFGAFQNQELIGVVSLYDQPGPNGEKFFRLRGMAVTPEFQCKGIGSQLVVHSIAALKGKTEGIWCNARESALSFYQKFGFECFGDEFDIETIGPHFVMLKRF